MTKRVEQVEDTQVIFDGGVVISYQSLRALSEYAMKQSSKCEEDVIHNDVSDEPLKFWTQVVRSKTNLQKSVFKEKGSQDKTLNVRKEGGYYYTTDEDGSVRNATKDEVVIYLAFMVGENRDTVEEASKELSAY